MISKAMEDELYSFIVDSNLEWSLIDQLEDKTLKKSFIEWLGLEEGHLDVL